MLVTTFIGFVIGTKEEMYHIFGFKNYKSLEYENLKTIKHSKDLKIISLMNVSPNDTTIYKYADSKSFWPNDKFQIVAAVEDNTKLSLLYYEDDSKSTFSEIRILVSIKIVFSTSYLFNN